VAKLMKPSATPAGASAAGAAPADTTKPATTKPATTKAPAASGPPPSAPPAPADGDAAGFPVVVERVRLDAGSLSFADLSLVLPFATRVHGLSGVVVGLGSDPGSRATVKLDGRVDEYGLVKVDGALSAFRPKSFTDITVIFRNVPMSTLTPYSATFAGRRIVAGTMNLDLEYKVDNSALVGENKVVLQKLQLGERVESAGAMRLPLDLAIAILSDSEGRIDIALPVRGNVDSPEFSYGHLIWQALVTVIRKVVTSPFRALGGLFGGEGEAERLQTIAFEPGSDVVRPPEREKLQRVADMLGKKPQLTLTVHGGYEANVDGEALRSLRVRREVAQRLGVKVKPDEDPGPVAFDQAKTQRTLEALLTERAGPKAIEEFEASYQKSTGKKAQRVNPVLAFVGRGSEDRGFYEAVFRRLVETASLSDAEITALGQRRGEATARVLKERSGAAATRVQVGQPEAVDRAERSAVPSRLELGAVGS
jgi:outer membrane protein OmpA-like peptidoglycan-associated protein